jgi:hypothetical protein
MSNRKDNFFYYGRAERKCWIDIFARFRQNGACVKNNGRQTRFRVKERFVIGKYSILTGKNGKGVRIGSIGSGSRIRVSADFGQGNEKTTYPGGKS